MNKAQKLELGNQIKEKFLKSKVVIFADYKGVKATEMDELRKIVRNGKGEVRVIKNNVIRKALADRSDFTPGAKQLLEDIAGPVLVTFSYDDPAVVAKAINGFAKTHEALQLRTSLMGNESVSSEDVKALADLPSKEILVAQLLGVLNGPIRNFVGVLAAVPRGFVTVLDAVGKKKQE